MKELKPKLKSVVQFVIVVIVLTLIITIISLLMLKYSVEGENNMPFELSQFIVVSTAEGIDKTGENTWNFDLVQNNDMYLTISKNKNYKETEIIKTITLNNFKIEEKPKVGKIVIYKPSDSEDKIYEYKGENIINDEIVYTGQEFTNIKNLEVANQGGIILLRFCNNEIGEYSSDDEAIKHDGTILTKLGLEDKDIKCKISFDVIIELTNRNKIYGKHRFKFASRKYNN